MPKATTEELSMTKKILFFSTAPVFTLMSLLVTAALVWGGPGTPAPMAFLTFLANDMAQQPERLQAVDAGLVQHLQALVGQVKVDLDAALPLEDE